MMKNLMINSEPTQEVTALLQEFFDCHSPESICDYIGEAYTAMVSSEDYGEVTPNERANAYFKIHQTLQLLRKLHPHVQRIPKANVA